MVRCRVWICVGLVFLSCALRTIAQQPGTSASGVVPAMVNFSGTLTDANGKPFAGMSGVTFSFYKDSQGGSPLWLETQNVKPDNTGHYIVMLGSTSSHGLPAELFVSGEARWLGVQVEGQAEQPRVLLLSVPYALKAGDAQTVGGLPPSAFVMAAQNVGSASTTSQAVSSAAVGNPDLGGSGTTNFIPLWTPNGTTLGNSVFFQSGAGATAKVGLGLTNPLATLDINGITLVRGTLETITRGVATSTKGFKSNAFDQEASSFNSSTNKAVMQHFEWQAEPTGNNTSSPGATLNLLFGQDNNLPAETGVKVSRAGVFTFAPGQTFPGAGTVTSVALSAPSADFNVSGSPVTQSGTLGLSWKVPPTNNNTANAIVKRDANGAFSAGLITASSFVSTGAVVGTNYSGTALGPGVEGDSTTGIGVTGKSTDTYGVYGNGYYGVGVYGVSYSGQGVWGESSGGGGSLPDGVHGVAHSSAGSGVAGVNDAIGGTGVYGSGSFGGDFVGLDGSTQNGGVGVFVNGGFSDSLNGGDGGDFIGGPSFNSQLGGNGIFAAPGFPSGENIGVYAAYLAGDVFVDGNLSKGGGSFKIDHPLDPANKYLYHSFVESPDMMNVYNGNIVLDANGEATVNLPDWFEVLNRDFRYQLTSIGGFAPIYIAQKVQDNAFKIAGGKAGMEVSWQVTGIRQDAWANAHRIPVEQIKSDRERGFYLHPEFFGQPAEKNVLWGRNPEMMKRLRQRKTKQSSTKHTALLEH